MKSKLDGKKRYIQNNTELALVRVLANARSGAPAAYALSAAGPELCRKLRDLLPGVELSSVEANGVEVGVSGVVSGEETCLMLFDLFRMLRRARNDA